MSMYMYIYAVVVGCLCNWCVS